MWTKRDGCVEDTDVVVWYTFVLDHVPRLEDWPMVTMHVEKIGFCLVPCGFFNSTPAIDLPRQQCIQGVGTKEYTHTSPDGEFEKVAAAASSDCGGGGGGGAACSGSGAPVQVDAVVPGKIPSKL